MNLHRHLNRVLAPCERVVERIGPKVGRGILVVVLLFLWLPIGVLVFMSFAEQNVLAFPPEGYTLDWYIVFLENDQAREAFLNTLKVSAVATPIAVFISVLIAYAIDRYAFPGRSVLQLLAALPIIVPLIIVAVALTLFFGTIGLSAGFGTIVIAHVIRIIPFAFLIILPTFMRFDRTLEEAAKDLGADEFRTFRRVTLPNVMPGIAAGTVLAFTISFNEFIYTYFVKDTATETLPTFIWDQIRWEITPEINVISVVFLGVAILTVLVAVGITNVERVTERGR